MMASGPSGGSSINCWVPPTDPVRRDGTPSGPSGPILKILGERTRYVVPNTDLIFIVPGGFAGRVSTRPPGPPQDLQQTT
jgi:hypothetical protein